MNMVVVGGFYKLMTYLIGMYELFPTVMAVISYKIGFIKRGGASKLLKRCLNLSKYGLW